MTDRERPFQRDLRRFTAAVEAAVKELRDFKKQLVPDHAWLLGSISDQMAELALRYAGDDAEYSMMKGWALIYLQQLYRLLQPLSEAHYQLVAQIDPTTERVNLAASRFRLNMPADVQRLAQLFYAGSRGELPMIAYNILDDKDFTKQPNPQFLVIVKIVQAQPRCWILSYRDGISETKTMTIDLRKSGNRLPATLHHSDAYVFVPPPPSPTPEEDPIEFSRAA